MSSCSPVKSPCLSGEGVAQWVERVCARCARGPAFSLQYLHFKKKKEPLTQVVARDPVLVSANLNLKIYFLL